MVLVALVVAQLQLRLILKLLSLGPFFFQHSTGAIVESGAQNWPVIIRKELVYRDRFRHRDGRPAVIIV
jgi:hypothetical protein